MEVLMADLTLNTVSKNLATFNLSNVISGAFHRHSDNSVTIVLDGGYVMGKADCPACAIEKIGSVAIQYMRERFSCGIDYMDYKRLYLN